MLALLLGGGVALAQHAVGDEWSVGKFRYKVTVAPGASPGQVKITKSNDDAEDITIPETVSYSGKEYRITSIGAGASRVKINLKKITLPASLESIEKNAFQSCIALENVVIPDAAPLTSIGEEAFSSCSKLTEISLPVALTTLEKGVFENCTALESLKIPAAVTSIGEKAFSGCSKLKELTLSAGLTTLGKKTFMNCKALESLEIPAAVTSIGLGAFDGCTKLTGLTVEAANVTFEAKEGVLFNKGKGELIRFPEGFDKETYDVPATVAKIWSGAFRGNESLKGLKIPKNVVSIEKDAFAGCTSLKEVFVQAKEPPRCIMPIATGSPAVFYVPAAEHAKYAAADGWKKLLLPADKLKKYSIVTFDTDGGEPKVKPKMIKEGEMIAELDPAPTKDKHTLKEWKDGVATFIFGTTLVNKDITLKAVWKKVTYKVTYDTKGGQPNPRPKDVEFEGKVTKPADPAIPPAGVTTFVGWRKKGVTDGKLFDFDKEKVTEAIELQAVWGYTVEFFTEDGQTSLRKQKVEKGMKAEKPEPTILGKSGQNVEEWHHVSNNTRYSFSKQVMTDLKLKAVPVKVKTYIVRFEPNGATEGASDLEDQTVNKDGKVTKPNAKLKKKEFTFVGWRKKGTTGKLFNFNEEKVTEPLTLEAVWGHTVSFMLSNGDMFKTIPVESNIAVDEPQPAPQVDERIFMEWRTLADEKYEFATKVQEDLVLVGLLGSKVTFTKEDNTTVFDEKKVVDVVSEPESTPSTQLPGQVFREWQLNGKKYDFSAQVLRNITLKPVYGYEVTFKVKDGEEFKKVVEPNTPVKELDPKPEKKGYKLSKWKHNGNLYNFNTKVTQAIKLEAEFEANSFDVKFTAKPGSYVGSLPTRQKKKFGQKVELPAAPQGKGGRAFMKWYKGEKEYDFDASVEEDLTLTAKFGYYVTFLNGTTPIGVSKLVMEGTRVAKPEAPTNGTSTFVHWKEQGTNQPYNFFASLKKELKLVAVWGHKVTFDLKDGKKNIIVNVKTGKKVDKLPPPQKPGHDFLGWKLGEEDYDFNKPVDKDITIEAAWKIKSFKVTFDKKGGEGEAPEQTKEFGSKVDEPEKPTLAGKVFMGWRKEGASKGFFEFKKETVEADIKLVAVWGYNVKFVLPADKAGESALEFDSQTVEAGKKATEPKTKPEKEGHDFKEWQLSGSKYLYLPVDKNLTIEAKFDLKEYTVTFVPTDGTGGPGQKQVKHGETLGRPAKALEPTSTDYTFVDWSKKENALEPFKFQTTPAPDKGEKLFGPLTLYAIWGYTVTFEWKDLLSAPQKKEVPVAKGQSVKPIDPGVIGKKVRAWKLADKPYDFKKEKVNGHITLVAEMVRVDTHKVTFDANEGQFAPSQKTLQVEVNDDTEVRELKTLPTRAGYKLMGWRLDGATDLFKLAEEKIKKDLTLKAVWGFEVIFQVDGKEHQKLLVEAGTALKKDLVKEPKKPGHIFKGWMEGNTPFDLNTKITGDLVLTAHHERGDTRTVSFVRDAAKPSDKVDVLVNKGEKVDKAQIPPAQKSGYVLVGWRLEPASGPDPKALFDLEKTPIEEDITLNAVWGFKVEFLVSVDPTEEPFGKLPSMKVEEGVNFEEPQEKPEPKSTGETFKFWAKKGETEKFDGFGKPLTASLVLVAQWGQAGAPVEIPEINKPDGGTITLKKADGTELKKGDKVNVGEKLTIEAKPDAGKVLDGEVKVEGLTKEVDGTYTVTGDPIKVEAKFKDAKKVKIPEIVSAEGTVTLKKKADGTVLKKDDDVLEGEILTLEITANDPDKKEFDEAASVIEGLEKQTDGSYKVTGQPITIEVKFKDKTVAPTPQEFTVTVTVDGKPGKGMVKPADGSAERALDASTMVKMGDVITLEYEVPDGKRAIVPAADGVAYTSDPAKEFTVKGDMNVKIVITFEDKPAKKEATIPAITQPAEGTVALKKGTTVLNEGDKVTEDDELTLEITANEPDKKEFDKANSTIEGLVEQPNGTYKITGDPIKIEVKFKDKSTTPGGSAPADEVEIPEIAQPDGGKVTLTKEGETKPLQKGEKVKKGEKLVLKVEPDAGKELDGEVKVEGLKLESGDTYTVTGDPIKIEVKFKDVAAAPQPAPKPEEKKPEDEPKPEPKPEDSTPVEVAGALKLRVLPAPATDFLTVDGMTEYATVRIYSLLGQQVLTQSVAPGATVDVRSLDAGVYLLQVQGQTVKFVKR